MSENDSMSVHSPQTASHLRHADSVSGVSAQDKNMGLGVLNCLIPWLDR